MLPTNKAIFSLFVLSILAFSSCSVKIGQGKIEQEAYKEIETKRKASGLRLKVEELRLPTEVKDTILMKDYQYCTIDGQAHLFVENLTKKSIDIYNLADKKRIYRKFLRDTELNRLYGKNRFYFHNLDSIFVLQDARISIIDSSGKVIYDYELWDMKSKTQFHYKGSITFKPYYESKNNKLYLERYCSGKKNYDLAYYDLNVEASFDMSTETFEILPVPFSKMYVENNYGLANNISREVLDSFHLYSYQVDPNIYVYNKNSNTLSTYGGRSKFHQGKIIPLSNKEKKVKINKIAYLDTIPVYNDLLFDPYRELYYRFFEKDQPKQNKDGTFNTNGDKEKVLLVFDKDFHLLEEFELKKHRHVTFSAFCTEEGLFIPAIHYKGENRGKIVFDKFIFDNTSGY